MSLLSLWNAMECYGSCRIGVSVGMWCRRILTEPRRVRFVHWLQVDWDIWDGRPMAGCCWHYLRKPPWVPPQVPIKELSGSGFQMREVRTGHGKIIKNQQIRHQFVLGRPWRNTQALCRFHIIYSLADSFAAVQLPRKADSALAQS